MGANNERLCLCSIAQPRIIDRLILQVAGVTCSAIREVSNLGPPYQELPLHLKNEAFNKKGGEENLAPPPCYTCNDQRSLNPMILLFSGKLSNITTISLFRKVISLSVIPFF